MLKIFKKRSAKGFTLIELLVVVVIIGILAAVALPNLIGQTSKARTTEATATLSGINTGQEAFFFENTAYTTIGNVTVPTLPAAPSKALAGSTGTVAANGAGDDQSFQDRLGAKTGEPGLAARWVFATTALTAGNNGIGTTFTAAAPGWNAGASGRGTAAAPIDTTNLNAYMVKGNNGAYIDSDNTQ